MINFFFTKSDPALEKYGAGRLSHPKEYTEIFEFLRQEGVEVVERVGVMGYSPAKGEPGRLIIDRDCSISALRHEVQHYQDDKAFGFPGLATYLQDEWLTWKFEFNAYWEEIKFAKNKKDFELGRKIVKLMKERRFEILGE